MRVLLIAMSSCSARTQIGSVEAISASGPIPRTRSKNLGRLIRSVQKIEAGEINTLLPRHRLKRFGQRFYITHKDADVVLRQNELFVAQIRTHRKRHTPNCGFREEL